mgnify:CR=1 FL=1
MTEARVADYVSRWLTWPSRWARRAPAIAPGLYHYVRAPDGMPTRFHLRVDQNGSGVLLANATAAARLRPSGVIIAKGLLDREPPEALVARLRRAYRGADAAHLAADVEAVRRLIAELEAPGDNYPILNLFEPIAGCGDALLDKPLSADVPLGKPAVIEPILRRLWDLGIPHVTLLVGSEPDEKSAIRAVELAEDLGMIAGVRGHGLALARREFIARLAGAGLDHLDVYCLSCDRGVHDSLAGEGDQEAVIRAMQAARKNEVCVVATIVLLPQTLPVVERTIEALVARDVSNAAFLAVATADPQHAATAVQADALFQAARLVEESAERHNVRMIWYPPVRFAPDRPLLDQVFAAPRAAGDHAIRVEWDGTVLAARGPRVAAGNLLADDWEQIRAGAVWRAYLRLVESSEHCDACPGLVCRPIDCPRNPARWAE